MKGFFETDWEIHDKVLAVASAFLLGVIVGFVFSPVKKGIYCGNHNGNKKYIEPKQKKNS